LPLLTQIPPPQALPLVLEAVLLLMIEEFMVKVPEEKYTPPPEPLAVLLLIWLEFMVKVPEEKYTPPPEPLAVLLLIWLELMVKVTEE